MLFACILMVRDMNLEKGFVNERYKNAGKLQRVSATNSFRALDYKSNSIILDTNAGQKGCVLWIRIILLLFSFAL